MNKHKLVFMNINLFFFTNLPGHGETGHVHLSNTRQLPSTGRSVIPCYSAAKKTNPKMLAENHHFCRVHEQNADFALLTGDRPARPLNAPSPPLFAGDVRNSEDRTKTAPVTRLSILLHYTPIPLFARVLLARPTTPS